MPVTRTAQGAVRLSLLRIPMARRAPPLSVTAACWLVVGLWAPYALLNTLFPGPALTYTLGMALALAALGVLWLAGVSPHDCFVRVGRLSPQGAALLALLACFIPIALLAGRGQPPSALDDLVYAPASAIAQELYFRAALLYALTRLCRDKTRAAVSLQALAFALWHARAFEVVPVLPALAVLAGTFAAGMFWGVQVRRDRTVLYAAAEHTLFLIVQ
ncbi:MAG TPA: CPBP family intramembrane glutamic endopeptidase [Ktedonobacterales bacterium]|jgi:Type II CAAX prenyl endopeptidase Rce1-like|nr:CPBP family intramembrane glutamic endopeptidase [Ktedonobacterales bacterium]